MSEPNAWTSETTGANAADAARPTKLRPPLVELTLTRFREFFREPVAVFWVYGFPLIMAVVLGIAFRGQSSEEPIAVDIIGSDGEALAEKLSALKQSDPDKAQFKVTRDPKEEWQKRLRSGKTDLVIEVPGKKADFDFWIEPNRAESATARYAAELALSGQRPTVGHQNLSTTGIKYIHFLMPGMLGMNLMGGGLWGVGFVLVDMRVRKLLKRFLATPMRRSDFLLGVMLSRLIFTIPEVLVLLGFGYLVFQVPCEGSVLTLLVVILVGGASFAGIGLLIASRAQTIETVSGLMNLVMLPMWLLSGVFFTYERFPEFTHPALRLLPLSALNDALRGVMLDRRGLLDLWYELTILTVWGVVSFAIALRIFRWR